MGTSGVAIFDDDLAADVRREWRETVLDGDGTDRVVAAFRDALDDPDDALVFWLALALAQHETGRLEGDVRDRALGLIERGGDVQRWDEEGLGAQRRRVLTGLEKKLRGPQPAPKRVRRTPTRTSPLKIGDVVRVHGEHGRRDALLVTVGITEAWPPGSTEPVLATLLWDGGDVPDLATLERLPLLIDDKAGRQMLHVAGSLTQKEFREAADVVAHGLVSRDVQVFDRTDLGYCGWDFLRSWIEGEWYERCVAATRARASRD